MLLDRQNMQSQQNWQSQQNRKGVDDMVENTMKTGHVLLYGDSTQAGTCCIALCNTVYTFLGPATPEW